MLSVLCLVLVPKWLPALPFSLLINTMPFLLIHMCGRWVSSLAGFFLSNVFSCIVPECVVWDVSKCHNTFQNHFTSYHKHVKCWLHLERGHYKAECSRWCFLCALFFSEWFLMSNLIWQCFKLMLFLDCNSLPHPRACWISLVAKALWLCVRGFYHQIWEVRWMGPDSSFYWWTPVSEGTTLIWALRFKENKIHR